MRIRKRLAQWMRRYAPFVVLWRAESHDHAETKAALAVAKHDLAAHAAHFQLAVAQREAERVLRIEAEERVAELHRQLAFWMDVRADTLPDAGEYGAWMRGEGRT